MLDYYFNGAVLHNVSELDKTENGYGVRRFPARVEAALSDVGKRVNHNTTGVELRFVINSGTAKLTLRQYDGGFGRVDVYYGNIPAGYTDCERFYGGEGTTFEIAAPPYPDCCESIADEFGQAFAPQVVRVLLPTRQTVILDVQGDIRPPLPNELPAEYCVFYGSSITNGSLSLRTPDAFPFRIAQQLKLDYNNFGLSGSAFAEPEVAEFLADMKGMKFISLELSANMCGYEPEDYKRRVKEFIRIVGSAHTDIPIFCTDIFYKYDDFAGNEKPGILRRKMRELLCELDMPNTVYIDGGKVFGGADGLSADLVHPGIIGINRLYENYLEIIKRYI